jgi:hypothetical protein
MPQFWEIFQAGDYPQGNFSEDDIQQIAENYDPSFLQAPISLDHQFGGPAYGWIDQLKADGKRLLASFKDVSDELVSMVANKRYKRHSVEIYNDLPEKGLYLKGLSMLGVAAPQVKGMEPIAFAEFGEDYPDDESTVVEIEDEAESGNEAESGKDEAESGKSQRDKPEAESGKQEGEEEDFQEPPNEWEDFRDLQKKLEEAQQTAEKFRKASKKFKQENEKIRFAERKAAFTAFLARQTQAGKLPPKLKPRAVELFEHLDGLDADGERALQLFKDIIQQLPAIDLAPSGGDEPEEIDFSDAAELAGKISRYMAEQKEQGQIISPSEALKHFKTTHNQ